MRSSPRQESAFARCRSWTLICPTDRPEHGALRTVRPASLDRRVGGGKPYQKLRHRRHWADFMKRMNVLAAALFILGAGAAANAQQTATPSDRGEYLARAGDCISCHSVRGGKAFAGGLPMGTPMGVIYSTNITPDPENGIGEYSLEDFDRALRSGV